MFFVANWPSLGEWFSQVSGRKSDFGIRSGKLLFILQYWGEEGANANLGGFFGVKLRLEVGAVFFAKQICYLYTYIMMHLRIVIVCYKIYM